MLDLDWDAYGEAAELLDLGFKYNHLYRCFTLYSRGFFEVQTMADQRRVRFFFRSAAEQERDAVSLVYSILRDRERPSYALTKFLTSSMPVISTVLPHYIEKTSDSSIRLDAPPDLLAYFKEWAQLQAGGMRFDLPSTWSFDGYTLDQFRSFWMSLMATALAHITAHDLADSTAGTRGGAIASLVMQMRENDLLRLGHVFPVSEEACRSIIKVLIYEPSRNFWDPFWQPIIRVCDGVHLVAPHLIATSSPERNLITLLNRSAPGRQFYNRVSSEKEAEQLNELSRLFPSPRYVARRRIPVPRRDGSTLTDIDLMVYDRSDAALLLVHAKWLIRPDAIQEVLAKDEEVQSALASARNAVERITELGHGWISAVLATDIGSLARICSVVINRDFVPSGWVYDAEIPVVNSDFVTAFTSSSRFSGLSSLYAACAAFYAYLAEKHPLSVDREEIQFGDYTFEFPTIEQRS